MINYINFKSKKNKGFSIIEVVISISIISLIMISISSTYSGLVRLSYKNTDKLQAAFILNEGVEIIKMISKQSWSNIASSTLNTNYYFYWSDNTWKSTTTENFIDNKYIRKYSIHNVYRDSETLNIVNNGGYLDEKSKLINLSVLWNDNDSMYTNTKQISFYVYNLYE